MALQPFYGKGPRPLLWAGSQAAREKITVSGIPNRLHYYVIFILYTQFTKEAAGGWLDAHDLVTQSFT
jgi:hypothetical protein